MVVETLNILPETRINSIKGFVQFFFFFSIKINCAKATLAFTSKTLRLVFFIYCELSENHFGVCILLYEFEYARCMMNLLFIF